jgi:hypothetical protein
MIRPLILARAEWLLITAACIGFLVSTATWGGLAPVMLIVLFGLGPDVSVFAMAASRGRRWSFAFYNATHSILLPATLLTAAYVVEWAYAWTLLAWLIHIGLDRSIGFSLRDESGRIHETGAIRNDVPFARKEQPV